MAKLNKYCSLILLLVIAIKVSGLQESSRAHIKNVHANQKEPSALTTHRKLISPDAEIIEGDSTSLNHQRVTVGDRNILIQK